MFKKMRFLILSVHFLFLQAAYSQKISFHQDSVSVQEKFAKLLGVSKESIINNELYGYLSIWLNTPYCYSGNSKHGIDCSGFVGKVYKNVYGLPLNGGSEDIFPFVDTIPKSDLKEGDLLFFKIYGNRISHIGLYLMNNKFIHATTLSGVIISDLDEDYYRKYYYKSGRIKRNDTH